MIEDHASGEQRANGYDLADYLINQQREINKFNEYADEYNAKLKIVLSNEKLKRDFQIILDERISVMEIDEEPLQIKTKEKMVTLENVRRIVLSL